MSSPEHLHARYRNLLASVPRGHQVSVNVLRERIETAQLNTFEKGELFRYGVRNGYLVALDHWEPSTAPQAKSRWIRTYRRTDKPIPGVGRLVEA